MAPKIRTSPPTGEWLGYRSRPYRAPRFEDAERVFGVLHGQGTALPHTQLQLNIMHAPVIMHEPVAQGHALRNTHLSSLF